MSAEIIEDFAYRDLDARPGHLQQFAGKKIVVHFWATWCVPCQSELPALLKTAARNEDIIFLLISVDENAAIVRHFIQPFIADVTGHANIILALDSDKRIATTKGVTGYPESFIVNPDRTLDRHLLGPVPWAAYRF